MRVNIYAEEMTNRLEIIGKEIDGHTFTGLRFYLELPATVNGQQYQAPFMHRPGDDDSSAVTFWGKRDLRNVMTQALQLLDQHYDKSPVQTPVPPVLGELWSGQGGYYMGTMPARDGRPAYHLVMAYGQLEASKWGPYDHDVSGANSRHDGRANTKALIDDAEKHPAAEWAGRIAADGHSDFYLPAQAELCQMWINAPQLFQKEWYWSSTQYSPRNAWVQDFENGHSTIHSKNYEFRAVAVRRLEI